MKAGCPNCAQHIEAEGELIGENIVCPTCTTAFTVTVDMILPVAADDIAGQERLRNLEILKRGMDSGELKFRVGVKIVDDATDD